MPTGYKRERYEKRLGAMKDEQSSFRDHWRLLSEFVRPMRGKFEMSDRRSRGSRRHQSIINARASFAQRTAVAGMFNGTMSPTQPWLMLGTDEPGLMEFGPVKQWFAAVQSTMRRLINDSNIYGAVPAMLDEELLFGTGCLAHEDDPLQLMRFQAHTIGSYYIAQDHRGVVDTIGREFEMTVEQMVRRFSGPPGSPVSKKLSVAARDQYDRGNYDAWIPVAQFVHPNPDFAPNSNSSTKRAFASCYYEHGGDREQLLEENGYHEFPFYCPRWEVVGEDVYGTSCPGMVALGDIRQLQLEERRKAQGIDKMVSPVLHGPASLKNVPIDNIPGGSTLYDATGDTRGLRAVYEVRLPIGELTADIQQVEGRINEAYFVDLFRAIGSMQGVQPRNELELLQRNQERLVELGPVLERQYGDFLNPLISRTFNQMWREGLVPPPPQELQGRPLRPRYVSLLALAQHAATTGNIDRLIMLVTRLSAIPGGEQVVDKIDLDQIVDDYGQMLGVPFDIVVPDEQVAATREARAQQLAQQRAAEMAQMAANTAKMAGDAKMDGDSVLSRGAKMAGMQQP